MTEGSNVAGQMLLWAALSNLKMIPRTGWLHRGIPPAEVESVADHSHLTSLLAWVVACDDKSLDAGRVLQLAAIHDIAEAIVGDQPPYAADEVPRNDPDALKQFFSVRHVRSAENTVAKRVAEDAAAEQLFSRMSEGANVTMRALWREYEEQITPEARFVKEVDRLEAFIQSRLYAQRFPDTPVLGFTDMALKEISHPALVKIRDAFLA